MLLAQTQMQKRTTLLFLSIILLCSVATAQRPKKYYKDQIQNGEQLLKAEYHQIYLQTTNGELVKKVYYPEKKIMTHRITYTDPTFQLKDGPYQEWYDTGQVWKEGQYSNNQKTGDWTVHFFNQGKARQYGKYETDKKQGTWIELDKEGRILIEQSFEAGLLHGLYKIFDTEGKVVVLRTYDRGEKKTEQRFESEAIIDTMKVATTAMQPFLKGCDDADKTIQKMCSDRKLLEAIYQNIHYPIVARRHDIEGEALFSLVVEKDGSVTHISTLRGLCAEIEKECLRVINQLPAWNPGEIEGQAIRTQYYLPIRFKLE